MQIQSFNNKTNGNNFKASFPVYHWVAEANGSYAPISDLRLVKKLQCKLIRALNKPLFDSTKPMNLKDQKLRAYLGRCDVDYRNTPKARSFYNVRTAGVKEHISFMITGGDVDVFEDKMAKDIGRSHRNAGEHNHIDKSKALERYHVQGLNFVKDFSRTLKDVKDIPYLLCTKFEIVRNRLGKIKDYRFIEARFIPPKGQENLMGSM